jgi:CBS domain containing-hemolysin-like protein
MAKKRTKNFVQSSLKNLQQETRKQTATALITAFGIILALVWKDVIQIYIEKWAQALTISQLPNSLLTLYSAIVTTILIVLAIMITNKYIFSKEKQKAQSSPK